MLVIIDIAAVPTNKPINKPIELLAQNAISLNVGENLYFLTRTC